MTKENIIIINTYNAYMLESDMNPVIMQGGDEEALCTLCMRSKMCDTEIIKLLQEKELLATEYSAEEYGIAGSLDMIVFDWETRQPDLYLEFKTLSFDNYDPNRDLTRLEFMVEPEGNARAYRIEVENCLEQPGYDIMSWWDVGPQDSEWCEDYAQEGDLVVHATFWSAMERAIAMADRIRKDGHSVSLDFEEIHNPYPLIGAINTGYYNPNPK